MGKKDPRVDAYIARAAPFAKPILRHLRKVSHAGCPALEETIKWGVPSFEYKGMMCGMASFKNHVTFGFWKGALLAKRAGLTPATEDAMGQFGRITSLSDMPSEKTLIRCVKEAAVLNDAGIKAPMRKNPPKPPVRAPAYFMAAVRKNKKALATFEGFSPSNRREYVEWITGTKSADTRQQRLDTAVQWMAEGKVRNWKYVRK